MKLKVPDMLKIKVLFILFYMEIGIYHLARGNAFYEGFKMNVIEQGMGDATF